MYILTQKLKAVKRKLKVLHRDKFFHITERVEERSRKLVEVQEALQREPFNVVLQERENIIKQEYQISVDVELKLLKQKAKADWLSQSDTNTAYYHSRIRERRSNCRITSIYTDRDELVNEDASVQKEFLNFYDGILGTREDTSSLDSAVIAARPVLSAEHCSILMTPITDGEIKEALFSIPSTKSPGPDGFTSGFYKEAWPTVGTQVCAAVHDFFKHGKLLKEINTTAITLVPKIDCPKYVGDYRPIA